MKCFTIPLILLIFGCQSTKSQVPNNTDKIPQVQEVKAKYNSNKLFFLVKESFPLDEKNRQFLKSEFSNGIIVDFENESHEVALRYRFFDDEMQVMHLDKIKAIHPQRVNKIIFKSQRGYQTFVPKEYLEKEIKNIGFFELHSNGKISLLKGFRKGGKNGVTTKYFYQKDGYPAQPLKPKKSAILNVFGNKKSEISKFIVQHKLNVKKESDLVKIFNHYNSLY